MKLIKVTAAIIVNNHHQVLVSQRSADAHQGNLWEFPGGKLEPREDAEQALSREVKEELGLVIAQPQYFYHERHAYPDCTVDITFYWVDTFSGVAQGMESQQILWADKTQLQQLAFPAANQQVLLKVLDALP